MDKLSITATGPIGDCKKCVNRFKGLTNEYECYWITIKSSALATAQIGGHMDTPLPNHVGIVAKNENNSICCNYEEA